MTEECGDDMRNCNLCLYRAVAASSFDMHFDERDCPIRKTCFQTCTRCGCSFDFDEVEEEQESLYFEDKVLFEARILQEKYFICPQCGEKVIIDLNINTLPYTDSKVFEKTRAGIITASKQEKPFNYYITPIKEIGPYKIKHISDGVIYAKEGNNNGKF